MICSDKIVKYQLHFQDTDQQWCRSLLSIGEIICNFTLFSTLGRINLHHDFVQVWKFSEDQNKMHMEHFFPQIQKTKKKSFIKHGTLFSPIFPQMYTHSNYWGDTAKLLGNISPNPPPPLVSALRLISLLHWNKLVPTVQNLHLKMFWHSIKIATWYGIAASHT